jgi:hypothetical protein
LGERRCSSYSFSTSALDGGQWSASCPGRALVPGKKLPVPIVQEAGRTPEPVWTRETRGKILSPLPGIEPRSPGRLARSQTLYWLSYPAHPFKVLVSCILSNSNAYILYVLLSINSSPVLCHPNVTWSTVSSHSLHSRHLLSVSCFNIFF